MFYLSNKFLNIYRQARVKHKGNLHTSEKNSGTSTVRFIIEVNDNAYYISSSGNNTFSTSNPTALSWFAYNPGDFRSIGSSVTLDPADYENITAVGLYVVNVVGGQTNQSRITSFQATGDITTVPEPMTYTLLAGTLALLFVVSRRRR